MTKTAVLSRLVSTEHGVFGQLQIPGGDAFFTIEDEWLHNKPQVSCIPAGTYLLEPTIWHRHNLPTHEVVGVPGRSRILIHPGNTEEDTEGCILLGMQLGFLRVQRDEETGLPGRKLAVLRSRPAFDRWGQWIGREQGKLVVRWEGLPDGVNP